MTELATPDDLPAIRALHTASWRQSYRGLLPDHLFGEEIEAVMAAKWAEPGVARRALVVRGPQDLLGFAAFEPDRAGEVFLDNLHVRPDLKGQGVGATLMRGVAREAGARPIWLEVLAANEGARRVYRRWGGAEGPIFDDRIMGVSVPGLIVRWEDGRVLLDHLGGRAD